MQKITGELEQEGAEGLLEAVMREAQLVRHSGLFEAQATPIISLLDDAINKARDVR
jgi:hypothetical protein